MTASQSMREERRRIRAEQEREQRTLLAWAVVMLVLTMAIFGAAGGLDDYGDRVAALSGQEVAW